MNGKELADWIKVTDASQHTKDIAIKEVHSYLHELRKASEK